MDKIAVIGIGRLGLCLALNLERAGYSVIGIDKNGSYVTKINSKKFVSPEPYVSELLSRSVNFIATSSLSEIFIQEARILFVVVPTPSLSDHSFDHKYINEVAEELIKHGKKKETHYLIINSTTMPGYCDGLQERLGSYNYEVVYNPEFIAQGSIITDQRNPDMVLIGEGSEVAGKIVEGIYKKICNNEPVFSHMSPVSAEITKLATNCFLTTKIAFANAVGDLAIKSGAQADKILEAIGSDSRIGNKYFKYGFGYGGPCFPRDNKAFLNFAGQNNYTMKISLATDEANELHADFLLKKKLKENRNGDVIEFDSVTYKKGTDIIEESQQLKLALDLASAGRKVCIKESEGVINSLKQLYGDIFIYQVNEP